MKTPLVVRYQSRKTGHDSPDTLVFRFQCPVCLDFYTHFPLQCLQDHINRSYDETWERTLSTQQIEAAKSVVDQYFKACQPVDDECAVREHCRMGYRNSLFQIKVFREEMLYQTGNGCRLQRPIAIAPDDYDGSRYDYHLYCWYQCPACGMPFANFEAFYEHMFGKPCTLSPYHIDSGQTPGESQPCPAWDQYPPCSEWDWDASSIEKLSEDPAYIAQYSEWDWDLSSMLKLSQDPAHQPQQWVENRFTEGSVQGTLSVKNWFKDHVDWCFFHGAWSDDCHKSNLGPVQKGRRWGES